MQPFRYGSDENFRYQRIKGQIAEELVRGLLETSPDYQVYPFGYEGSISDLRYQVKKNRGKVEHTPSNDRMRSMPDLVLYDRIEHKTSFVEVKYRGADSPQRVTLNKKELTLTQTYWNDSILVVVIPSEHNFYAQKISDIKIVNEYKSHGYDLTREFKHFESMFPKVRPENVEKYSEIRAQFLSIGNIDEEESPE